MKPRVMQLKVVDLALVEQLEPGAFVNGDRVMVVGKRGALRLGRISREDLTSPRAFAHYQVPSKWGLKNMRVEIGVAPEDVC